MELLRNFEKDLRLRRRSHRTIQGYRSNVKEFLRHYPDPAKVDYGELEDYLDHLLRKDLKPSTLKSTFSAISSFYEFLIYKRVTDTNPVTGFRKRYLDTSHQSDRRQVPTVGEVRQLITRLDHIRDIALIMVLAKTGIRREELLLLTPDDIDLERNIIIIERKKRAKNRVRFIDIELNVVLEEYLFWRKSRAKAGKCLSYYLWISDHGGRVHKDYVNAVIQHHGAALGIHDTNPNAPLEKRLSCHCFRGFLTTHLRRNGMKKEHIKTLLGHTLNNEVWTGHYLDIDMGMVHEEYLNCVPQLLDY